VVSQGEDPNLVGTDLVDQSEGESVQHALTHARLDLRPGCNAASRMRLASAVTSVSVAPLPAPRSVSVSSNTSPATLPVRTSLHLRIASCLAFLLGLTSTLALTACDLEEPSPNEDTADLLFEAEVELTKTTPSIDELLEDSEAAALQTWLERQGYSMVSSEVELASPDAASDALNVVIQFAKPGSEERIGAAIAFRLTPAGEVLEVAAVMADDADKADQGTCLAPLVYHASSDVVTTSYYWGIKFNTCDPCGGVNPNGCCGCLPGHPC
jgi:hypothetical protein